MVAINNFLFYGIMLLCTNFLQNAQHLSSVVSGFYLMPANLAFFFINQYSNVFEKVFGERMLVVAAWVLLLGGLAWLAVLNVASASWQVAGGLFVMGGGCGLVFTPACSL